MTTEAKTKRPQVVRYEFETRLEAGETLPVAPGVVWLRSPLPFKLDHINLWLLEDGDGWTVVDTGIFFDESKQSATHRAFKDLLPDCFGFIKKNTRIYHGPAVTIL
jgi:glyoxylase-like metal-dependent hydrolase (beta-lactamase superfamily II)